MNFDFKKFWKEFGVVALVAVYALVAVFLMPRCSKLNELESAAAGAVQSGDRVVTVTPKPQKEAKAEETAAPTEKPKTKGELVSAKLAYAGDLVCHMGINEEAWNGEAYDYQPIMEGAAEYVQNADFAFCCLETTFPEDGDVSGFPVFHSPKALAKSIKDFGFDMLEMASNHSMDARQEGLISTLDVLDFEGLDHVGTYRTQAERDKDNGVLLEDVNGIKIAFLNYTYGTNGFPVTGFEYAVNIFFDDYLETDAADIDELNLDKIDADIEAAKALNPDLIAVCMHWGLEYHTSAMDYQKTVADHLFEQGADLVLGGHPHVPEPMEVRHVTDKDGNEKTGYLCYCMGNFISCMNDPYTNLTAVTTLEVEKDTGTGETYLKNVSYAPMIMIDTADHGVNIGWRYKLVDLHKALDTYAAGDNQGYIDERLHNDMLKALDDIHGIFGAQFDMYDPSYTANTEGEMPVPTPAPAESPAAEG